MRIIIALLWIPGTQDPFLVHASGSLGSSLAEENPTRLLCATCHMSSASSPFATRLLFVRGVVVNSPPTGACVVGCCTALGKSICLPDRGLGNGPRVTGLDLADHSGQHVLLRRQDLVASGRSIGCDRFHRPSIHTHLPHHGSCISGGAAWAGVHRV